MIKKERRCNLSIKYGQYVRKELERLSSALIEAINNTGEEAKKTISLIIRQLNFLEPEVANMDTVSSDHKKNEPGAPNTARRRHPSSRPKRLFSEKIIKYFRLRFGLNSEKKRLTHQEAFREISPEIVNLTKEEQDRKSLYLSQEFSKSMKELGEVLQNGTDSINLEPDNIQLINDLKAAFPGKNVEELKGILKGKVVPTILESGSGVAGKDSFH
jgi:hypothetical protein